MVFKRKQQIEDIPEPEQEPRRVRRVKKNRYEARYNPEATYLIDNETEDVRAVEGLPGVIQLLAEIKSDLDTIKKSI
jgi:hypothetical protein